MSKKTVELNLCDICVPVDGDDIMKYVATNNCSVCERDYCASKHIVDSYSTTRHMSTPFTYDICDECWKLLAYCGYKTGTTRLPYGSINLHASGSASAINIAEFREYVRSEADRYANDAVVRVLKAIRAGRQDHIDAEAVRADAVELQERELKKLLQKKYEEARAVA